MNFVGHFIMELRARVFRLEDLLIMSTQPAQGVNIM